MKNPLVSVIIPVFNRAGTIGRAIKSCLSQDYGDLELLVVDDHSSDNTGEIIKGLRESRVRYIYHEQNRGPAAARNSGLRAARGEFIAFLDSDDEWLPEKISRQLAVFHQRSQSDPRLGLVFVNGGHEAEGHDFIQYTSSGTVYDPQRDNFYPLRVLICPPSAWLLPKRVVDDVGFFDERMYNWDDGDYLARVGYKYSIYFLNERLVVWHASPEHVNAMSPNLIKGKELFLENNFDYLKQDREYLFKFYRALGKDAYAIDRQKARHYLWNAFLLRPFDTSVWSKLLKGLFKVS